MANNPNKNKPNLQVTPDPTSDFSSSPYECQVISRAALLCVDFETALEPETRLKSAIHLLNYFIFRGEQTRAQELISTVNKLTLKSDISQTIWVRWHNAVVLFEAYFGQIDKAQENFELAFELIKNNEKSNLKTITCLNLAIAYLCHSNESRAQALIKQGESYPDASYPESQCMLNFVLSWQSLCGNNLEIALSLAQQSNKLAKQHGHQLLWIHCQIVIAFINAALGKPGLASEINDGVREKADKLESSYIEFQLLLTTALAKHRAKHQPQTSIELRAALTIGQESRFIRGLISVPWAMAEIAELALENGIETHYVRNIIRQRTILPNGNLNRHWPWPIRVYTLGRFNITIENQTLKTIGKAQQKPLKLLQALVTLGGREVHTQILSDTLWPESNAGHSVLESAIHRLRKLIGNPRAIIVSGNKVTLNNELCWVDSWAFERHVTIITNNNLTTFSSTNLTKMAKKLIKLYPGQFCAQEQVTPWNLGFRNKLHSKYLRAVQMLGVHLEKRNHYKEAADLYTRSLECDPYCEQLYLHLMRCNIKQGFFANALTTYNLCCEFLENAMGISSPSNEMKQLHLELLASVSSK